MHIQLDLTRTQYFPSGSHHSHGTLSDTTGCSSGSITSYDSPDMDSYSSVCQQPLPSCLISEAHSDLPHPQVSRMPSFTYSNAADTALLTPASSAGSPPMQQREPLKPLQSYHSPQTIGTGLQENTPPSTARLYYGFGLNSSSQSPSPMAGDTQTSEAGSSYELVNYVHHSTPPVHHPSSPKDDIPPPIQNYYGGFGVSGQSQPELPHVSHHAYDYHPYPSVDGHHDNAYIMAGQMGGRHHLQHNRLPSLNGGHGPLLNDHHPHPHPSHFYQQSTPRIGSVEDLRDPVIALGTAYHPPPVVTVSPSKKARAKRATAKKAAGPRARRALSHSSDKDDDDTMVGYLELDKDCPADDRYLFDLRREFLVDKGKGMWEGITAQYSLQHKGSWKKPALQMKVCRMVSKWGIWPQHEVREQSRH